MTLSANDFELLLQANRILSSKLNVDDVLQAVLELATKVVKAQASSLLLLDEKTNELYFDVALGDVKDRVKQIRIKVGEGIAGWVAKKKSPLIVNDVRKDPRFTTKVDKSTNFVTKSILAVPVRAKGRLIGVLEAINKENDAHFSSEDKEAFGVFASQAGIAIENARLFSAVSGEKQKLSTIFSEMSDGLIVLDEAGHVELINEAGTNFLSMKKEAALGKKFGSALFPGFQITPPIDNLAKLKDTGQIQMHRKEPKDFYVAAAVRAIRTDRAASGWLVILHDVTEIQRGEKLKRDFLSLISHKLKTPLTVIVGYAPALQSKTEGMSEFQKKAIKAIATQGDQLSELVEKLLQFTIVESTDVARKTGLHDVKPLIDQALSDLKYKVDETSAQMMMKIDSKLPKINVDPILAVAAIRNVIENAIKFNDKEKKTVEISANKGLSGVSIAVRDNGVGIPSEERSRVFEKFYQIENSFTGQVPGAGLGLTLCKKVVEQMGGSITIDSAVGRGTTVTMSLPVK